MGVNSQLYYSFRLPPAATTTDARHTPPNRCSSRSTHTPCPHRHTYTTAQAQARLSCVCALCHPTDPTHPGRGTTSRGPTHIHAHRKSLAHGVHVPNTEVNGSAPQSGEQDTTTREVRPLTQNGGRPHQEGSLHLAAASGPMPRRRPNVPCSMAQPRDVVELPHTDEALGTQAGVVNLTLRIAKRRALARRDRR